MSVHGVPRKRSVTRSASARICLSGENLDWYGSTVVLAACRQLSTSVTVSERGGKSHFIKCEGTVRAHALINQLNEPDSVRLPLAAIRGVDRLLHPAPTISMRVRSTIPAGAGLASSAALSVAALSALSQLMRVELTQDSLANIAHRIETEFFGNTCGIMDHIIAVRSGFLAIDFSGELPVVSQLRPNSDIAVIVADTGDRHTTGLIIESLRDRLAQGEIAMNEYFSHTAAISKEMVTVCATPGWSGASLGSLMNQAHGLLRDFAGVSTTKIEAVVSEARTAGALGAKVCGAGLGGCVVAISSLDSAAAVSRGIEDVGARVLSVENGIG